MSKEDVMDIFHAALSAVDPFECVAGAIRTGADKLIVAGTAYDLDSIDRIIVVGAGKASVRMASAVETVLGSLLSRGLVIAPYGQKSKPRTVEIAEASHPLPDNSGVVATGQVLELVRTADEKTLVICLMSGGGSALLVAPVRGITLEDKQKTTDLLLRSGCSIGELNTVRKHLSTVKGGGLSKAAQPASLVSLILSDVVGDHVDVIASGPAAPDSSTFADAARVIDKYGVKQYLPSRVVEHVEKGVAGREPETAKKDDACFFKTRNVIVAGLAQALFAARNRAKTLGYNAVLVTPDVQGPARDVGRILAQTALSARNALKPGERRCLLFGGETTAVVKGNGKGGRNQELALVFAREISGTSGVSMLSAATDGVDGPTDAAGAFVDGTTVKKARHASISPEPYLENNDSYSFFRKVDHINHTNYHVLTGPTGTNVMDLQVILLEG